MIDFDQLYRGHAADVHRFALHLSGDTVVAEDLVAETFIRVWTARDRVELATVRGYLFAIARNLFLKQIERGRRETTLEEAAEPSTPGDAARLDAARELQEVLRDLQTLSEIDRTALLLRAEADLSYDEIARILGISETAAKVKVHRARLRLVAARGLRTEEKGMP